MTFRNIGTLLVETVKAWLDDDAPVLGAALAYYTLFSIAPLLVIVIAIAGIVFGRDAAEGQVLQRLSGMMGPEAAATVQRLLLSVSDKADSGLAAVLGGVAMLIGSTTAFAVLQRTLNRIWRAPEPPASGSVVLWIRRRLLSFVMVLGFGVLLLASLVLSTVLPAIGNWWGPQYEVFDGLAWAVEVLGSLAVTTFIFAMIYRFLPRVSIAWRDVWIGAAVTALLFVFGETLIGLYLGRTGLSSAFGAAGSVLVLLVWLYYSAQIFLLGAEFTWIYAHRHGSWASEQDAARRD